MPLIRQSVKQLRIGSTPLASTPTSLGIHFARQSAIVSAAPAKSAALFRPLLPPLLTLTVFALIFRRVPFGPFLSALQGADYLWFAALMVPNGLLYFAWDTLVLVLLMRWFHGPIRYRELLPVRAVTYVVSFLNTNLARAATAYYLTRKLRASFLPLAGTVIFLTLLEMTHLVIWATAGMLATSATIPRGLFGVPLAFLLFWVLVVGYAQARPAAAANRGELPPHRRLRLRPFREWDVFQTFTRAPLRRYFQVILLRAPLFAASLGFHYFAVQAFGMHIPLLKLVAFLPIIFMLAALPVTVAHLGTTQAAWIFFFRDSAPEAQLLAYSLASHLAFMFARAAVGVVFLPKAYKELFGPIPWKEFFTARQPAPQASDG